MACKSAWMRSVLVLFLLPATGFAQTWAERAAVIDAAASSSDNGTSRLVVLTPAEGKVRNFEIRRSGALSVVFDFERNTVSFVQMARDGNRLSSLDLNGDKWTKVANAPW